MNEEKIERFLNPKLPEEYTVYRDLHMYRRKINGQYFYSSDPSFSRDEKIFPTLVVSKHEIAYLLYTDKVDPYGIIEDMEQGFYESWIKQFLLMPELHLEDAVQGYQFSGLVYPYRWIREADGSSPDRRIVINPDDIERTLKFTHYSTLSCDDPDEVVRKINIYIQDIFDIKPVSGPVYDLPPKEERIRESVRQSYDRAANSSSSYRNHSDSRPARKPSLFDRILSVFLIILTVVCVGGFLYGFFKTVYEVNKADDEYQEEERQHADDDTDDDDSDEEADDSYSLDSLFSDDDSNNGNEDNGNEESGDTAWQQQQRQQMMDQYNKEAQQMHDNYNREVQEGNARYQQRVKEMDAQAQAQYEQQVQQVNYPPTLVGGLVTPQ